MIMNIEIQVYGAEIICASCVNMPSAKETVGWLEAALERKFKGQPFSVTYIDIFNTPSGEEIENFAEKLRKDELFYPLVVINGKIVGEGDIRLNKVVSAMEEMGYHEVDE
jgi:disulfide oxidoreductase YuzD